MTKTNEEFSKYMEDQLRKLQLLRDLMRDMKCQTRSRVTTLAGRF